MAWTNNELMKKKLVHDAPIQLGKMILDMAKIRMLQWVYDFLLEYLQPNSYKYIQMDTDSLYSFFDTKPDLDRLKNDICYCPLESLVMPEKLNSFREGIYGHCYDGWQPDYNIHFLTRCCCKKHAQHNQKTPGLFKLEAYGKSMVALCSKIYALELMDGGDKLATKGVQKKALLHTLAGASVCQSMAKCLNDGDDLMVENSSFRLYKQEMHTVKQKKSAYNQIYVKRKVLDDGISTEPLDIVLRPYKKLTRGLKLEILENPVAFNPEAETITNSQDEARVRVELGMGQLEDYDIYDSDQEL